MNKIRIGIVGYGNIGKGVQVAIKQNEDTELVAVFTRRDPKTLNVNDSAVKVVNVNDAKEYTKKIDVMILCGGSATDLPVQGPKFAEFFNTVDSFDTHAKVNDYFKAVDDATKANGTTSAVCIGWDPGLFSMNRMIAGAILPEGTDYTFWGKGVSQGHSDAIRRVEGVKNGIQYTIPIENAIEKARSGSGASMTTKEKHLRECFVVLEDGADKEAVSKTIKEMPNYFSDYETIVNFISEDELKANHSSMPHGGFVIRTGKTGFNKEHNQLVEFSIKLDSNPEFTSSVLVAYARAVYKLNNDGQTGAKTVFDIPIGYLSPKNAFDLRKELL